jgi:large subunit ribosomal protein L24
MQKIKKGDLVQVVKGKDSGKTAKVLTLLDGGRRALVEGLNLVKKHKRQTRQDQQGGIVSIEAPISISSLMFFCKSCNAPVRVGFAVAADKTKSRICKNCKGQI